MLPATYVDPCRHRIISPIYIYRWLENTADAEGEEAAATVARGTIGEEGARPVAGAAAGAAGAAHSVGATSWAACTQRPRFPQAATTSLDQAPTV
jgi:hypothetical protein